MTSDQVYYKLRSIGCSVETSDAIAPIVAKLSDKKREAFFLWACGMEQEEAAIMAGMSYRTFKWTLARLRKTVAL